MLRKFLGDRDGPPETSRESAKRDVSNWVEHNGYRSALEDQTEEGGTVLRVRFSEKEDNKSDASSSNSSSVSSSTDAPVALDGGYAWYIVFISFMIHGVCDGVSFSFGFIFMSLQDKFGVNRFVSSVIGGVFLSLPLINGPYAGVVTDIYDCRKTAIAGSGIVVVGMVLAAFCDNIITFAICFSGIGGFGMSFLYNTAICMVTYYFDKRRGLATGIATCGTGIGTSLVAVLLQKALTYNLQVGMLTCAFLFAFLCILAFTMKDVTWSSETTESKKRKFDRQLREQKKQQLLQSSLHDYDMVIMNENISLLPRRANSLPCLASFETNAMSQRIGVATSNLSIAAHAIRKSLTTVPMSSFGRRILPALHPREYNMLVQALEPLNLEMGKSNSTSLMLRPRIISSHCSMTVDALLLANEDRVEDFSAASQISNHGDSSSSELRDEEEEAPEHLRNGKLNGTTESFPLVQLESALPATSTAPRLKMNSTRLAGSSNISTAINSMARSRVPASNAFRVRGYMTATNLLDLQGRAPSAPAVYLKKKKKRTLAEFLHVNKHKEGLKESFGDWVSTARTPMFALFLSSVFLLYLCYDIPYVNFPEYVNEEMGLTKSQSAWLVAGLGFANSAGMILFGILGDTETGDKHLFLIYGSLITCAGLSVMAAAFINSYSQALAINILFGFFIAGNYSMCSVLTLKMVNIEQFQAGYSVQSFITGIANLIGPPLVGFVRDHVNSYTWTMLVGGIGLVCSGLIVVGMYAHVWSRDFKSALDDTPPQTREGSEKGIDVFLAEKQQPALMQPLLAVISQK